MERVALITGASRGLGAALARTLVERGWSLVLDARGADDLAAVADQLSPRAALHGAHVVAIAGDVADPEHRRVLADSAARLGRLELLVNNASTLGPSPLPGLARYPLDELRRVYDV